MSLPLEDALRQCQRHAAVMLDAMGQIPFPLEEKSLQQASPELIRFIDQFLLRFSKLQDTLGTHVLRQFATQILVEPVEDSSFVEVLGLLERRGFLTAKEWALQRSTRNALTHEYPEDFLRQALALTGAKAAAMQLLGWLEAIQKRVEG